MAIKLKLLRDDNIKLANLNAQRQDVETQLVEAKIKSANLDLENDQLACKLQSKNDQIKKFSERITALEIDLLKTKQELGEALNAVYEYESVHHNDNSKVMMTGGTMVFGGSGGGCTQNDSGSGNEQNSEGVVDSMRSGGGNSNDGGSGSTMKKMSNKDKIKNFFKKHTNK